MRINAFNVATYGHKTNFTGQQKDNKSQRISAHSSHPVPNNLKAIPLATLMAMSPMADANVPYKPNMPVNAPQIEYVEQHTDNKIPENSIRFSLEKPNNSSDEVKVLYQNNYANMTFLAMDFNGTQNSAEGIMLQGEGISSQGYGALVFQELSRIDCSVKGALGTSTNDSTFTSYWVGLDENFEPIEGLIELKDPNIIGDLKECYKKFPPSAEAQYEQKIEHKRYNLTVGVKPNGELYLKQGNSNAPIPNLYDKSLEKEKESMITQAFYDLDPWFNFLGGHYQIGYSDNTKGFILDGTSPEGKPVLAKIVNCYYSQVVLDDANYTSLAVFVLEGANGTKVAVLETDNAAFFQQLNTLYQVDAYYYSLIPSDTPGAEPENFEDVNLPLPR